MKAWLAKVFEPSTSSPQPKSLDEIQRFGDHFERVPGTDTYPEHLIAHGVIKGSGTPIDIRTALNVRDNDVEFTSDMGQLPNNSLGAEIKERLNHVSDGKFVTFDTEQAHKLDLVYATRKPADWINPEKVHVELEHHAKTKVMVQPVLNDAFSVGQPSPQSPSIKDAARDIVDNNLQLQDRLRDKLPSARYFPIPQSSKGNEE